MESETNQESFGSYLKSFRVKQKMAVKTISHQTKIAVHCLRAIEDGAHESLPPKAYVKSFLRTYANAVGADADVAVERYMADLALQESAQQQLRKRREKARALRRFLLTLGLIAAILLLLRFTNFLPHPARPPETPVRPVASEPAATIAAPADVDTRGADAGEKLKLKIVAVEKTWLKVIVDGQNARSYDLKPEDRLELEGTDSFNLMIGNAAGLDIYLDERPVKIFGKRGQVVSLKIP